MTFQIQTNAPSKEFTVLDQMPTWFLDAMEANASEAEIVRAFAQHVMGEFSAPKTMETVRKRIQTNWFFLLHLSKVEPDLFDEVLGAYAERWLRFDESPKQSKARNLVAKTEAPARADFAYT